MRHGIPVPPQKVQGSNNRGNDDNDGIGHGCGAYGTDDGDHHASGSQKGTAHAPGHDGNAPAHWNESFELSQEILRDTASFADTRSNRVESTKSPAADRQHPPQGGTEELEGYDAKSHLADQRFLFRCKRTKPGSQFLDAHRHGLEVRRKRHC